MIKAMKWNNILLHLIKKHSTTAFTLSALFKLYCFPSDWIMATTAKRSGILDEWRFRWCGNTDTVWSEVEPQGETPFIPQCHALIRDKKATKQKQKRKDKNFISKCKCVSNTENIITSLNLQNLVIYRIVHTFVTLTLLHLSFSHDKLIYQVCISWKILAHLLLTIEEKCWS